MTDSVWKDLLSWQKEMNAKDDVLSRSKPVHDQTLPPIRPSAEINLDSAKPVGLDTLNTKKPSSTTVTNKGLQTRAEKAEAEKAKGNEYFVKKDYKNAILHYGKAIDLDPTVPVYFVNRAMAYLKTNSFLEAEKDCTRGIQLQPKNVKALWRRGIALKELGRIREARKDFELGLQIEPSNKSIMDELKKLPAALKTVIKPKVQQPVPVEKRRLPINVIDEAYPETKAEPSKAPSINKKIEAVKPTVNRKIEPMNSTHEKKPEPVEKKSEPVKAKPLSEIKKPAETSVPKTSTVKFTCPRTNFEFERDWKTYKGRGDDTLYQYFQCLSPSSYATLFKSSLESDQFEKMIELLQTRYIKEKTANDVYNVLEGLSRVKRIDMLIMFLSKTHHQAIRELFDFVKSSSTIPKDALMKVAGTYGVKL